MVEIGGTRVDDLGGGGVRRRKRQGKIYNFLGQLGETEESRGGQEERRESSESANTHLIQHQDGREVRVGAQDSQHVHS